MFILPSFSETWGLSVNEAMTSGKAVIVSDTCGCCTDLIVEGKNGYSFINNNVKSLSEQLEKMTIKSKTREMGDFSSHHISSWSFENIVINIENALQNKRTN